MKKLKYLLIGIFAVSSMLLVTSCDKGDKENEPNVEEPHTHTYNTKFDSDNHWQECTCGDKKEVEKHNFGEWKTIKESTDSEEGLKECECSVCHTKDTKSIPKLLKPTKGLSFELNSDKNSYSVIGIETTTDVDIVIPSIYNNLPVTSIGDSAFQECSSLESIIIPNSVTSIGECAFLECSSLESITIPNSVTSIGDSAFDDCISLQSITIPNSVTSIGKGVFCGCSSLESIIIPNSVTSIDEFAFSWCSSLESIIIPNSITWIGDYAFWECSSLTTIAIPNSVTKIGEYAFSECGSLKEIYFNGTSTEWRNIIIYSYNLSLRTATIYYYSETKPTEKGNYWHYVDGVITKW